MFHCPEDGLIIILVQCYVRKGSVRRIGLRGTAGLPEKGHGLLPGAGFAHAKKCAADAAGDFVFHSPEYRFVIILAGSDVREGAFGSLGLRRSGRFP